MSLQGFKSKSMRWKQSEELQQKDNVKLSLQAGLFLQAHGHLIDLLT